jgi:tetratricopeptide (TPR) repeat protein/transcriptional regulator with XRE-family HTH domain
LTSETLGELLREFRIAADLTQGALAEKAGLSEQAVSLLERGTRRRPRISTVRALAEALALTPDEEQRLSAAATGSRPPQPAHSPTALSSLIVAPRQLPPTLADFTGRSAELETLLSTLTGEQHTGIVRMAAVTGMGGVGKTSLAVHAAHLSVDHYPDGHLYIDLRGYGPGEPIQPRDALAQLLRSLGFDSQSIPETVDEAAALYRSRLAGLRILVLLDNANGAAQVRPLLPGAPGAAAVVTSRRSLTTLPGFVQVRLTPLTESDSISLLGKMVGQSRVASETAAVRTISRLTGRLPLAVRLIGARLAARPAWPIEHVTDQLRDEQRRLDELGSGHNGVRANIAASVEFLAGSDQHVEREAAAALDLLGLPNGTDLVTSTTAHLLDESEQHTEEMLERLVDLNLLESTAPGRYRLHDLIKAYARERSVQRLSDGVRTDALGRVLTYYTGLAWRCHQATHPETSRLTMAGSSLRTVSLIGDAVTTLKWFDQEWVNLIEAFHQAEQNPALRPLLPELALSLFGYFESRARWADMRTLNTIGRRIAGDLGHQRTAAWLEHDLGIPAAERGELELSLRHLQAALEMFREIDDVAGEARCSSSVSHVLEQLGRLDEAVQPAERALELSQQIGDQTVEGISYLALGSLYNRRGETVLADRAFNRAFALAGVSGSRRSMARRYQVASDSYRRAGLMSRAFELMELAATVFQELSDETAESDSHSYLAAMSITMGDTDRARVHAEAAVDLSRSAGNSQREGEALIELGQVERATGDLAAARRHWRTAVELLHPQSAPGEAVARRLLAETE